MVPGLPHVFVQNGVMMQYFHWYYPGGGLLWNEVAGRTDELAAAGITALWLPSAYKGASQDVYVVGSLPELGDWDTDKAGILGSQNYRPGRTSCHTCPRIPTLSGSALKETAPAM